MRMLSRAGLVPDSAAFGRRPGTGLPAERRADPGRPPDGGPGPAAMPAWARATGRDGRRAMTHLLVTNDFPPKVGGIQAYLWELWRRHGPVDLRRADGVVAPRRGRLRRRAEGPRVPHRAGARAGCCCPRPATVRRIRDLADDVGRLARRPRPRPSAGPRRARRSAIFPTPWCSTAPRSPCRAGCPGSRQALAHVLGRARPGGVRRRLSRRRGPPRGRGHACRPWWRSRPGSTSTGCDRSPPPARRKARAELGLPPDGPLVVSVSRLVPRKGMDVLIDAAAALVPSFPGLTVAIAGRGARPGPPRRPGAADRGAPVRLLGPVPDDDLPRLYGVADVFVMACRDRWLGLEQEGFGIVFLEAAACGVPQVAGRSGGADEAVVHGKTGLVVDDPGDPGQVAGGPAPAAHRRRAAAPHGPGRPAPGRDRLRVGPSRT